MNGKCAAMSWASSLPAVSRTCSIVMSLAMRFSVAGEPDSTPTSARRSPDRLQRANASSGQPRGLVRPHRRRPRDGQAPRDELLGDGVDTLAVREERLILEVDVGEPVSLPEPANLRADPRGRQAYPPALVDERVGAERAAEVAALRADVIELPACL